MLAESRVAMLLKSLAVSKVLYELFEELLIGFNYRESARNLMQNEFVLPQDPSATAALVFCMLLDIDKRAIDLKDLLGIILPHADVNDQFDSFVTKLIIPFKNSIIYLISTKSENAKAQAEFNRKHAESMQELEFDKKVGLLMARVKADSYLGDVEMDDIIMLLNDLLLAKKARDGTNFNKIHGKLHKLISRNIPKMLPAFDDIFE